MFVYLELSFASLYRKKDPHAPRLRPHRLSQTGPSICPKQGQDFEPSAANGPITHPTDLLCRELDNGASFQIENKEIDV